MNEIVYEDVPATLRKKYVYLGMEQIGRSITDLSNVLLQGIREDNIAKLNGIAGDLQKAARHIQGRRAVT